MRLAGLSLGLSLPIAALPLAGCATSASSVAAPTPQLVQAQFEQRVEEGFGRLDSAPQAWVMLPTP